MIVFAGQQIERPLAVAGVDAGVRLDFDVAEEHALFFRQLVIDKGAKRFVRMRNRLQPANAAAEADEDDVWPMIWLTLHSRFVGAPYRGVGGALPHRHPRKNTPPA